MIIGYNQQAVICRAIKSALEQSYKNVEVIYVDDASTDDSIDIIKHSFPESRLSIIQNHKNQGSSVARLLGIKAATGEWCLFVDGDDFLCTDACEILHITISEQDEETDIIGFGANIICSESVSKVSENWIKDKACEPVLGSHSTRELLRIQYGTREKAWLVWNKCFRIDVLRTAEASAEYEVFYRLTDYYLCFLACSDRGYCDSIMQHTEQASDRQVDHYFAILALLKHEETIKEYIRRQTEESKNEDKKSYKPL